MEMQPFSNEGGDLNGSSLNAKEIDVLEIES